MFFSQTKLKNTPEVMSCGELFSLKLYPINNKKLIISKINCNNNQKTIIYH